MEAGSPVYAGYTIRQPQDTYSTARCPHGRIELFLEHRFGPRLGSWKPVLGQSEHGVHFGFSSAFNARSPPLATPPPNHAVLLFIRRACQPSRIILCCC